MGKLFSKENQEVFSNPLNLNNPVVVQVLGICSALAVTSQLKPAIVMGLSVTVITAFSNLIISLLRKTIPNRIRIIVQLVVVAALVTIVSMILKAYVYDVSVMLSVYVGLIRFRSRTSWRRLNPRIQGSATGCLRCWLHEQRYDDDASHGSYSAWLCYLGTPCI